MPRRGRGSRYSGGRNHAAKGAAALLLPQQANLIHHYDATNISTLWQDTGGTSAVTSNADPVARIDDLGTDPTNLIQATAENQPQWDAAEGCIVWDGNDALSANPTNGISGGAWSWMILGMVQQDGASGTRIAAQWDGFSKMGCWTVEAGGIPTVLRVYASDAIPDTDGSPTLHAHGEKASFVATSHSSTSQECWYSPHAAKQTVAGSHDDITALAVFAFGANTGGGGNGFPGHIREMAVWNIAFTEADKAAVAAYDTAKHGTVWA